MNEIAIVGIGCRFPGGVVGPDSYWDFLAHKGDGVVDIPPDRWSVEKYYDPDPEAPGRMYTRRGGFLTSSLWDFDPEFFGISPREASIMDPQQRLLLEVAWEALDDAGLAGVVSGRSVGVYVGAFTSDSSIARVGLGARLHISGHTPMSYTFTLLSNRISYVLNLNGPSMTIDTACSSSLVAFHLAVRAISQGECEVALAGGVNVMTQPETYISMSKGRFLAADGRSKAFDAAADGYGRGEGAAIAVLKPLSAAVRDGDRIYAVVRGTGVNQDGRTSAIPVPNPEAQEILARRVCADADVSPHEVAYVEAHGTGTPVGDPLELAALGKVYGTAPGRGEPLAVGSVKASIGHLEAAAGIAGVIKAALCVHHRAIPPQGWLEQPNPEIPFDELNINLPTKMHRLEDANEPMLVAVNSFGYGGTNAHAILQSPPRTGCVEPVKPFPVLPLSGRNPEAVRVLASRFAELLQRGVDLDSLAAAAWTRRAHHQYRVGFGYYDASDLLTKLEDFAAGQGRAPSRVLASDAAGPVFVFSGMGPQWWAMGRDLLHAGGEFARTARLVDDEFREIAGWSIVDELSKSEEDSRVTDTDVAQPANFLVQVALVAELAALGVHPRAVVGHSVGEVAAAFVSGQLSLRDACLVSYHRSRLQATTTGAMLAVGLSEADAVAVVPAGANLSVAAVNSPSATTLAGDRASVEAMYEQLTEAGVFARILKVQVGYHSHLMDPILEQVRASLAGIVPREPTIPLYSTVHSGRVLGAEWDTDYWCRNVREPVRFADTIANLIADGCQVLLEVGPSPVLSGNIREMLIIKDRPGVAISTLSRKEGDEVSLRQTIAELYGVGALDGSTVPGGASTAPHVTLPAYPWQKTTVWTEADTVVGERMNIDARYPMLGRRADPSRSVWMVDLSVSGLPWLHDHVVDGAVVLPGAAYLDAALSAAALRSGREDLALEDVRFVTPLVIDPHDVPVMRLTVEESTKRFTIDSRPATGSTWVLNASGRLVEAQVRAGISRPVHVSSDARVVTGDDMYPALRARGLDYGPTFRGVVESRVSGETVIATVDTTIANGSAHLVHPAVLDTALQCVAALSLELVAEEAGGAIVPAAIRTVRRFGPIPEIATVSVQCTGRNPLLADIQILDSDGAQVITMAGVEFRPVSPEGSLLNRLGQVFYEPTWELYTNDGRTAAIPKPDQDFVLVVALGESAAAAADSIVRPYPNAHTHRVTDPLVAGLEDEIIAALRHGLSTNDNRAKVVVVAGNGFSGSANVTATARVAAALATELDQASSTEVADQSAKQVKATILTENAFCLPGSLIAADMSHAVLVGARRSLFNEQPQLGWRLIDIDADTTSSELDDELAIDLSDRDEQADEVCLRLGNRWGLRVRRSLPELLGARNEEQVVLDPEASFTLEVPSTRLLQDLAWRVVERTDPADNEIEVRMNAIGLNPKDAFKVLGVLSDKDMDETFFGRALGLEGIGTVVRVGSEVAGFAAGDRVVVSARNMLRRYATIDAHNAHLIPATWETGACSSIVPFLTAELALVDSAHLKPGETVLIHGGAGGVGLAAIQVARRIGARVIATAGTEGRRAYVLEAGADHAIDSRSMNFVDDVMELTGGRGVDVVLNSAPGETVRQNFKVAVEFGRIVEIGKIDIYSNGVIDLRPFDHNLTLIALDLDRMMRFRPEAVRATTGCLIDRFSSGVYRHLPYQTYPTNDVVAAFEAVVRPKQVGRIVLDLDSPGTLARAPLPVSGILPDASYLVTGGFGAFGLATARWLVREGARKLILVGRSGAATSEAVEQVAAFIDGGVEVVEERLDIANYQAVADMVHRAETSGIPLRGVFHAAGIVNNSPVRTVTGEIVAAVLAPKIDGAVNLDRAVHEAGIELDHFVLWSSISALIGGFPQVVYAAANTSLQSLAHSRRLRGASGLCIDWGSMAGGGMAEANDETVRYLSAVGLRPISMDDATDYLGECIRLGIPHAALFDMDWSKAAATTHAVRQSARFADFAAGDCAEQDASAALRAEILALPPEQRGATVTKALAEVMAVVMGVAVEAVDVDTPLLELGMDSLMAVEFAARTSKAIGIELSPIEMARGLGLGLAGIAAKLAAQLETDEGNAA